MLKSVISQIQSLPSSSDPSDSRLKDIVIEGSLENLQENSWNIIGYADDEGIQINGGRKGASLAPEAIRRFFYRMTPPLNSRHQPVLLDWGDLTPHHELLAERHLKGRLHVEHILNHKGKTVSFGGGHDYGYSDGAAFLSAFTNHEVKPLILNFDAHLDVRPTDKGFTSGTPFRRLLEEFAGFDFVEIGIQPHCNAQSHLDWLKNYSHVSVYTTDQIRDSHLPPGESLVHLIEPYIKKQNRPIFVSFDMDVFSSAYAPGCSQVWPTGLTVQEVWPVLQTLARSQQVYSLGIYETSPSFDVDNRTARLAAQIAHLFIYKGYK